MPLLLQSTNILQRIFQSKVKNLKKGKTKKEEENKKCTLHLNFPLHATCIYAHMMIRLLRLLQ